MIDYSNINYCPTIRTRRAELSGLNNLDDRTKDKLLPLFVIGKWPRSDEAITSYNHTIKAFENRPHIIDLSRIQAHQNEEIEKLFRPDDNFRNWRDFVASINDKAQAIPTVLFNEHESIPGLRAITQQAIKLESKYGQVAMNIDTTSASDRNAALHVLSALDDPANCLCILQSGYITRETLEPSLAVTIKVMNEIRAIDPRVECVCSGSSFPRSPAEFGNDYGEIPILERDLYAEIGGREYAIYGDHASIHPIVYDAQIARGFVPRVDFPTYYSWIYYRGNSGSSKNDGYIECANKIINHDYWEDLGIWGTDEIKRVASGDASRMGNPSKWIAIRVNIHLYRQATLPELEQQGEDMENEFDDPDDFFR